MSCKTPSVGFHGKPGRPARVTLMVLIAYAAAVAGCTRPMDDRPPATLADLEYRQAHDPNAFTIDTIVKSNIRRVLDPDLPANQRIDSLEVVKALDPNSPVHLSHLALVLHEEKNPTAVRMAVLEMLIARNYPNLAPHVMQALRAEPGGELRTTLLDWLTRHPAPDVLAEVVRLWATEPPNDAQVNQRYERVVTSMTGKPWPEALLASLNSSDFNSLGSAMEILAARVSGDSLQSRLLAMTPRTEAMAALQYYLQRFDYLPARRGELLAAVVIHQTNRRLLDDAVRLANTWRFAYRYRFNIRDFHLLSRIERDPIRRLPTRAQIIVDLAPMLRTQRGTPSAAQQDIADELNKLTMADLVNVLLLHEMLSAYRIQLALTVMAYKDRLDTRTQWGGLIFYENGQAEARLYPPGPSGNDFLYIPAEQMLADSTDSLAHFYAHFQRSDNSQMRGLNPIDAAYAAQIGCYLLTLTSVSADRFAATYYNPDGAGVPLGEYPFAKQPPDAARN